MLEINLQIKRFLVYTSSFFENTVEKENRKKTKQK